MRRTASLLVVFLAWTSLSRPSGLSAADAEPGERALRVERWLKTVLNRADEPDIAAIDVSSWSNAELVILRTDVSVLVQLMRNPRLSSFQQPPRESTSPDVPDCINCSLSESQRPRRIQPQETIRYSDPDLHRLKVLACAASGTLTDSTCTRLNAPKEIDAELIRLAALAMAARERGDTNYVLRRGALLHGDAAMLASNEIAPLNAGGPDGQPVRIHIVDGEPTRVGFGEIHWEIARLLLDAVKPEHDAMVNLWYRATATWMQRHEQYDNLHLDHARELFPNDADIAFLSGCDRETDAGPAMQSVARTAVLPAGVTLGVAPERTALREAEAFFRRALVLNPRLVEARLRLGHVLLVRGRAQDAAAELRPAVESAGDPLLQYFGSMFLGAAEEALGRLDEAREAYARASTLFPAAQSPYLALSALARRRGDRAGALAELRQVFDLVDYDDPWWTYHLVQARNADALIDELRRPFLEAQR